MSYSELIFTRGIPSHDFFEDAWSSEPFTSTLQEVNVPFALASPEEDISLVGMKEDQQVGQCSMNHTSTYWKQLKELALEETNLSTQIFTQIHQKACEVEENYAIQNGITINNSLHNAGLAVRPKYRGQKIGTRLLEQQIKLGKELGTESLFGETTNRISARIFKEVGFTLIKEFPYSELSKEMDCPSLEKLESDSFTIWFLPLNKI